MATGSRNASSPTEVSDHPYEGNSLRLSPQGRRHSDGDGKQSYSSIIFKIASVAVL
jgi:hypothetical protein